MLYALHSYFTIPLLRFFIGIQHIPLQNIIAEVLPREGTAFRKILQNGLRPCCLRQAAVDELMHQRTVRCEMIPSTQATPIEFLEQHFSNTDGVSDWSIFSSMQYKLYDAYAQGQLNDLSQTDYWQWHASLHQAGINERPDEWIRSKINKVLRAYDSIRTQGYRYGSLSSFIWVLEQPVITTRYGIEHHPGGLEIFHGHHRAAAVAQLGYGSVVVLVLKDVAQTTPFGLPLEGICRPGVRKSMA